MISWREPRPFDFILLATAVALTVYGLLLIYSGTLNTAGGSFLEVLEGPVGRQLGLGIIAVGLCLLVARWDYRLVGKAWPLLYVAMLASLVLVLTSGEAEYGSRRWLEIGGQRIQPSEAGKLIVILALAKFLGGNPERVKDARIFFASLVIAVVPALLVFAEPDLGSASIFLLMWLGMVIVAGADLRHVLGTIGMVVALAPFALILLVTDYQRERISVFLDPTRDALGAGFNILQAEISVGSGGLYGKGLGEGSQTQLDYLRTQTTDYVFSVLGEELGYIGAMVLFALFILLLMRGLRAAAVAPDVYGRILAVGIVTFILFQAFINIGVNIRLFPVTGIPLPFISQGGSSLITVFLAIGLLESIVTQHREVNLYAGGASRTSIMVPPVLE